MKLEKLKRGTCILLAATLIGTVFAGCSKDSITESNAIASTSYVSEDISEYDYTNYIKDAVLIKYKNLRNEDKYIAAYPLIIFKEGLRYNDFNLYTLDKSELLYKGEGAYRASKEDEGLGDICKELGNKLGTYVSYDYLSKFLLAEYGLKKSYTKDEVESLINKLNSGEIVFDGKVIKTPESTSEVVTEENETEVVTEEETTKLTVEQTTKQEEKKFKLNDNGKKLYLLHTRKHKIEDSSDAINENSFCYIVYNAKNKDFSETIQKKDYKTGKKESFKSHDDTYIYYYSYIDVSTLLDNDKDSVTEKELNELSEKCSVVIEKNEDLLYTYYVIYNNKKYEMEYHHLTGIYLPQEVKININDDIDIQEAEKYYENMKSKYEDDSKEVSTIKSINR